jgi:hypothetical protein
LPILLAPDIFSKWGEVSGSAESRQGRTGIPNESVIAGHFAAAGLRGLGKRKNRAATCGIR